MKNRLLIPLLISLVIVFGFSTGAKAWQHENAWINSGQSRSIKVDSLNQPHRAFLEYDGASHYIINYSLKKDGSWLPREKVEDRPYGNVSLALDVSDNPHFAFGGKSGKLLYRNKIGGVWGSTDTVDNGFSSRVSMVLTKSGLPHIAYYSETSKDLKFAEWTGTVWSTSTIDSVGDVGNYPSLALDSSDRPRIAYYDATNLDLKYADWDGTRWTTQTVDSVGNVGSICSLALTNTDEPWISYMESTKGVKVAHWTGSEWVVEKLSRHEGVGYDASLAISHGNIPTVLMSIKVGSMGYLWAADYLVSSWRYSLVDSEAGNADATTDKDGMVHVAYGGFNYNNHGWQVVLADPGQPNSVEITSTSVSWRWTENSDFEDGLRIRRLSDDADLSGTLPANTTWWIQTGLTPNTKIPTIYVEAFQGMNVAKSENSPDYSYSNYTLANPPTDTTITNVWGSSLTLRWMGNGNPDGVTGYKAFKSTDNIKFIDLMNYGPVFGTSYVVTGLIPETTYFFRVQAQNKNDRVTAFDNTISTITIPVVPMAPFPLPFSRTTNSINWNWTDKSPNEEGFRVLRSSDLVSLSTDLPANTTYWIQTGLAPDFKQNVLIQSFNRMGTSNSYPIEATTLPAPPFDTKVTSVTSNSATISWSRNGNPLTTRFNAQYSKDGLVFNTFIYNDTVDSGTAWGLISGSTYFFRVKSVNSDSNSSPFDVMVSTRLPYAKPAEPTHLYGSALSTGSIQWTWKDNAVDEQGYRIVRSSDGVALSGDLPPGNLSWVQTDLIPATKQEVYVVAFNEAGTSKSNTSYAYPVQHPPTRPRGLSVTDGSILLDWQNHPDNKKSVFVHIIYSTFPVVDDSYYWEYPNTYQNGDYLPYRLNNLQPQTTYFMALVPDNEYRTDPSLYFSTVTLPGRPWAPTTPAFSTNTVRSITWNWNDRSTNEEGFRVLNEFGEDVSGPLPAGTTTWTQTPLTPGTTFKVSVESFNSYGSTSSALSLSYPTVPSSPIDVAFSSVFSSSATITWNAEGNKNVTYALSQSTNNLVFFPSDVGFSNNSALLLNLSAETTYYFRLTTRNSLNQYSESAPILSAVTSAGPPRAPSIFYAENRSTTSITWAWTDRSNNEEGFRIVDASNTNLSGDLPPGTTAWVQEDLFPAQPVTVQLEAFNAHGVSVVGPRLQYTLPIAPSDLSFSLVRSSAISLSWSANGNWPGTDYYVTAEGKDYGQGFYTNFQTSWTFTNLVGETTYTFKVHAYSRLLRDFSDYSPAISTTTPPGAPARPDGLYVSLRKSSSLEWKWTDNSSNELGFIIRDANDHSNLSGVLPPNTTYWVQRDLRPYQDYWAYVEAFNDLGISSSTKNYAITLPNPPSPLTFDLVASTYVAISWGRNGNPSSLRYRFIASKEENFRTLERNISRIEGTSLVLSGLSAQTTYYFGIGVDFPESELTFSRPIVTPVSGKSFTLFEGLSDQDIIFKGAAGEIRARLLKGTFPSSVLVTLKEEKDLPALHLSGQRVLPIGQGFRLSIEQPWAPSHPITLLIPYAKEDVIHVDESSLSIARFDLDLGKWVILPTAVDKNTRQLTAKTDQLGVFQIVSFVISASVSEATVFPNPWHPGRVGHDSVTITPLPLNATLKIYTLRGELVRELKTDTNGVASWNGLNQEGEGVASGVFVVRIEGDGGDKILKVAVQR